MSTSKSKQPQFSKQPLAKPNAKFPLAKPDVKFPAIKPAPKFPPVPPATTDSWSEFEEWGGRSWFAPCTCLVNPKACAVHGR